MKNIRMNVAEFLKGLAITTRSKTILRLAHFVDIGMCAHHYHYATKA